VVDKGYRLIINLKTYTMIKKTLLMLAVCLGCALPEATAVERNYNPTDGLSGATSWGTTRKENYDVAIKLDAAGLVGSKIKSVSIPVNQADSVVNYSIWLSSELKTRTDTIKKKKYNDPDITSVSVTPENGYISVTFAEPYTIPAEGVYVGASCEVRAIDDNDLGTEYPFVGVAHASTNGFWIHSSRTYLKWVDKSSALGFTLSVNVTLEGDFVDNAAGITTITPLTAKSGDKATLTATIANYGLKAINSVDLSYTINATEKGTAHVDLAEAIPNYYGFTGRVSFEVAGNSLLGTDYPLEVVVDKVNGEANTSVGNSISTTASYYSFIPVRRSVEEEYTDVQCGWCTRGFAALEHMSNKYSDFIGIAYHGGFSKTDPMQLATSYPGTVSGFPSAWFDRKELGDPFYGVTEDGDFPVEQEWLDRCAEFTPASLDVDAAFQSEESNIIDITASATFAADLNDLNYKLTYVLVADDLTGGTDWTQTNYYASYYSYDTILASCGIEELAEFGSGGKYGSSYVSDLHFNDVAIYIDNVKGIANSVPSSVKDLETVTHNYQIDITKAVNRSGESLVQDRTKLRVVALLLDANTGYIVNGARADVKSTTGVAPTVINGEVISSEYYDLSGRRIITPSNGIYVKRVVYSNGTVKTSKVAVR
jgi:hypothetical protein